jgi:hypothetical protein
LFRDFFPAAKTGIHQTCLNEQLQLGVIWFNIIHLDIRAKILVEADSAITDPVCRATALGVAIACGFEVHKPVLLRDFFPPVHIHLLAIIREIGWLREEDTYLQKYNIRTRVLVSVGRGEGIFIPI